MALNDVLHVKDLKLPAGVKPLADGEQIVAQVKEVKEEETAVTAAVEGEAEPEVIGKKKEDETPAEGAAAPAEEKK
jgi:hypothetical protein